MANYYRNGKKVEMTAKEAGKQRPQDKGAKPPEKSQEK